MSKVNDITLVGEKELRKLLESLPGKVRRKVLRQALNAAGTPVVKAVRSEAELSKESGTLQKSIGKKVKLYPSGTGIVVIGPQKGVSGEWHGHIRIPRYYAHLVEYGHISGDGFYVPPKPFIRPGWARSAPGAKAALSDKLAAGIVKEAKA
jgi:HK97 gp10 family phage protein